MIFTKYGCRFRVNVYGGLDLWLDEREFCGRVIAGEWVRFGWDSFGLDPGEWTPEAPP
jgi:hypothetical protein